MQDFRGMNVRICSPSGLHTAFLEFFFGIFLEFFGVFFGIFLEFFGMSFELVLAGKT